jgi:DNA helicase-2/ATP-dependent DNA helicase PcrA
MNQPNPPRFTPQGLIPTAEQSAIQLAQNKVVLVDANAGAAKTTTLALRIGEALARNLAPEQILALTFTPEAREVLRRRLLEIGVARAMVERIAVLSFEDFAAWMLDLTDGDHVRQCRDVRALKNYALQAMDYAGERYAGSVDGLELHTHSVALSQFLDVQQPESDHGAGCRRRVHGPGRSGRLLGVPLTDYLTTLEYERMRLDGGAGAVFRGPFDATYDLACNLHGGGRLAEQFPPYRLVLCDELHDLNEPPSASSMR